MLVCVKVSFGQRNTPNAFPLNSMEYLRSNFLKLRDVSGTQRCTVVRLITLRKKGRHARIPAARKKRGTAEGKRFNCEDISYMEVIGTAHVPRRRNGAERLMGPPRASQHSNIFNGLFRASYLNAIPRYLTVVWTHHRGQRLSYLSRRLKKAPPPSGTEDEEKLREEGKKNPRDEEEDRSTRGRRRRESTRGWKRQDGEEEARSEA